MVATYGHRSHWCLDAAADGAGEAVGDAGVTVGEAGAGGKSPTARGPPGPIGGHWRPLVGVLTTKHIGWVGAIMTSNFYGDGKNFPLVAIGGHWQNPHQQSKKFPLAAIGTVGAWMW